MRGAVGGGAAASWKGVWGNKTGEHLKHKKTNVKQKNPSGVSQPYYNASFTKAKVTKQAKVQSRIEFPVFLF